MNSRFQLATGLLLLTFGTFVSSISEAKRFQTEFVSLDLPTNWDCKKEEIDWVCQSDNLAERSEALVIIVTKAVNEVDDSLEKYKEVLGQTRPMRDLLGNSYTSEVRYVNEKDIRGHLWIDSLQLGPEIPGFYSRYVASIEDKVAALITYSVAQSVYPKYAQTLDAMIDSMEIKFDSKAFEDALATRPGSLIGKGRSSSQRLAPTLEGTSTQTSSASEGMDTGQIAGILIAAGAVGYLIWKRKQRAG
jgi:hypothetical protein